MNRYCSNNYVKSSKPIEICDWCRSEQKSSPCSSTSSKASSRNVGSIIITPKPSEYSGDSSPTKIRGGSDQVRKNLISGVPSPRTAARRYKLLKDVKCWIKVRSISCVCDGSRRKAYIATYIYNAINTHTAQVSIIYNLCHLNYNIINYT